jgi:hypothetical protein
MALNSNRLSLVVPSRKAIGDCKRGGAEGIRTPDPLNAIEMRSQLRYSPNSILDLLYINQKAPDDLGKELPFRALQWS